MGVKFNREYKDISDDLAKALQTIDDCYMFLEMEHADWNSLEEEERYECVRTLSDDIFYALGSFRKVSVGSGAVEYDAEKHWIKVSAAPSLVHIIPLI